MKKIYAILLMCVLTLAAAVSVSAEGLGDVFYDGIIRSDTNGSVFSAGDDAGSTADVNGVLFAAGNNVESGGNCKYAMNAGYSVRLSGSTENDAFLAGNIINIDGDVKRDVFAAGNEIHISGKIGQNLYAAGRKIIIDGEISGNVYLSAAEITVGDGALIGGKVHYNADAKADGNLLSGAEVYGSDSAEREKNGIADAVRGKVLSCIGAVALAFVLLWLTPIWETLDKKYYGTPFGKYAKTFGIGFGVLAAVPVAAVLLMISAAGIRLALILLMLYAAVIAAAPVFMGFFIGAFVWRKAFKKSVCYPAELAIGIVIWRAVTCIPVLSFALGLIAVPFALGVITLLLGKKRQTEI